MRDNASTTPETWLPAIGYEGWYEVSDYGRVRRVNPSGGALAGRILKLAIAPRGTQRVSLAIAGFRRTPLVHTLVAEAFLGPCPPGREVNHIDGNPSNNVVRNLEYITHSENMRHAQRIGLLSKAKLTPEDVLLIRSLRGVVSGAELARRFGVTHAAICDIQSRRNWAWL